MKMHISKMYPQVFHKSRSGRHGTPAPCLPPYHTHVILQY